MGVMLAFGGAHCSGPLHGTHQRGWACLGNSQAPAESPPVKLVSLPLTLGDKQRVQGGTAGRERLSRLKLRLQLRLLAPPVEPSF